MTIPMNDETDKHLLPPKTGALAISAPKPMAIIPHDLESAFRLAKVIAKSNLAPKGMSSEEQITVSILMGLELGISPMAAVQGIAVINGRPTIWGDLALAIVEGSGHLEYIKETLVDPDKGDRCHAHCEVKRRGKPTATSRTFSLAQAKKANLVGKDTYKSYLERMLQMRARGYALRDTFPDILRGIYLREEMTDAEGREMKDITPPPVKMAPPPPPPPGAPPPPPSTLGSPGDPDGKPLPGEAAESGAGADDDAQHIIVGPDYDRMIDSWLEQLKAFSLDEQAELFQNEIEPLHEKGQIFPPDYEKLKGLVKEG